MAFCLRSKTAMQGKLLTKQSPAYIIIEHKIDKDLHSSRGMDPRLVLKTSPFEDPQVL